MPFLEEEFQILKDPTKLADEGLLCFEAEEAPLNTSLSTSTPFGSRQSFCPTVCKKDKGKVIFFLEELPVRKRFLTKSGCLLERISYRFVSLGTENVFIPVSFRLKTLEMLPLTILERLWGLLPHSDQTITKLVCKSWRKLAEHFETLARWNSGNCEYLGNETGHEEEEKEDQEEKKLPEAFELEDSQSFIEVSSEGEGEEKEKEIASSSSSEGEVKGEATERDEGIEGEGTKGEDFSSKDKNLFTNWLYGASTTVLNSGGSATADSSAIFAR